jgi:WhiB family redox-sensing transcriptional regulator
MAGPEAAFSVGMSRKAAYEAPDTEFFDDAACQGADTAVFFPVSDTFADEAKSICATCPVAEQCLEYAIATHQSDGVWGGMTALERHRLVRRRQRVAREARERDAESAA